MAPHSSTGRWWQVRTAVPHLHGGATSVGLWHTRCHVVYNSLTRAGGSPPATSRAEGPCAPEGTGDL